MTWSPRPCRHVHVSGRPCDGLCRSGYLYCDAHASAGNKRALCDACRAMLTTFTPRYGWTPDAKRTLGK